MWSAKAGAAPTASQMPTATSAKRRLRMLLHLRGYSTGAWPDEDNGRFALFLVRELLEKGGPSALQLLPGLADELQVGGGGTGGPGGLAVHLKGLPRPDLSQLFPLVPHQLFSSVHNAQVK